jgi:hypothetical protein
MIHVIVSRAGAGDNTTAVKGSQHIIGHGVHFGDDRIRFPIQECFLFIVKTNDAL